MKRQHFETTIDAPRAKVWETMLAPDSYRAWTAPFAEGSYYDGSWEKGAKIRFLTPSGEGMSSLIADNRPHELISIRHVGIIKDGVEETESDAVRAWAGATENYTLTDADGGTRLEIDLDVAPEYEEMMANIWPKALAKLKQLCEA